MSKPQKIKMPTPKGVCRFPHLNDPDTRYKPVWDNKLVVELDAAEGFISEVTKLLERWHGDELNKADAAKRKKMWSYRMSLPWDDDVEKDTGEPTGKMVFKIKKNVYYEDRQSGEQKKLSRPPIFDSKNNPMPTDVVISGGSVVRHSVEPVYYTNPSNGGSYGITLRLLATQVIELKEWRQDPASFGFEETDGFSVADASEDSDVPF